MPSRPSSAFPARGSSSPAIPASRSTRSATQRVTAPSGGSGTSNDAEIARALGAATVAVFPYRAELDQSGALLQAIGAGVPAVVYDVGGLGEVVGAFGAGRVVPPGDVAGLKQALRELLDDADALAEARAGASRARAALTWDEAAAEHVALYEELV